MGRKKENEKTSPWKITKILTRNAAQKTNWQLNRLKSNGVCARKLQLEKKASQQSFVDKNQKRNTCLFSENDRAFYSLPSFSFTLQRLPREKFHFKRKNPTFLCVGVKSYRQRARSENSARSRNQSGCRI